MILLPLFLAINLWCLLFTVPGLINTQQSLLNRAKGAFAASFLAQSAINNVAEHPSVRRSKYINLFIYDPKRSTGRALQPYNTTDVGVYVQHQDELPVCWKRESGFVEPPVSFNPFDIFVFVATPLLISLCRSSVPSVVSGLRRPRKLIDTPCADSGLVAEYTLLWIENQALVDYPSVEYTPVHDVSLDSSSVMDHINDQALEGAESAETFFVTPADSHSEAGPPLPYHTRPQPDDKQLVMGETTAGAMDDSGSRVNLISPLDQTAQRLEDKQVEMENTTAAGAINDSGSKADLSSPLHQTEQPHDNREVKTEETAPAETEPQSSGQKKKKYRPSQKTRRAKARARARAEAAQIEADGSTQGSSLVAVTGESAQEPQPEADAHGQGSQEAVELDQTLEQPQSSEQLQSPEQPQSHERPQSSEQSQSHEHSRSHEQPQPHEQPQSSEQPQSPETQAGPSSLHLTGQQPDNTQVDKEQTAATGTEANPPGSPKRQRQQRGPKKKKKKKKNRNSAEGQLEAESAQAVQPATDGPHQESVKAAQTPASEAATAAQVPETGASSQHLAGQQPDVDQVNKGKKAAAGAEANPPDSSKKQRRQRGPKKKNRNSAQGQLEAESAQALQQPVKAAQTSAPEVDGPIQGPPEATKSAQAPEAGPSSLHQTGQRPDDTQVDVEKTAASGGEVKSTDGGSIQSAKKKTRRRTRWYPNKSIGPPPAEAGPS